MPLLSNYAPYLLFRSHPRESSMIPFFFSFICTLACYIFLFHLFYAIFMFLAFDFQGPAGFSFIFTEDVKYAIFGIPTSHVRDFIIQHYLFFFATVYMEIDLSLFLWLRHMKKTEEQIESSMVLIKASTRNKQKKNEFNSQNNSWNDTLISIAQRNIITSKFQVLLNSVKVMNNYYQNFVNTIYFSLPLIFCANIHRNEDYNENTLRFIYYKFPQNFSGREQAL